MVRYLTPLIRLTCIHPPNGLLGPPTSGLDRPYQGSPAARGHEDGLTLAAHVTARREIATDVMGLCAQTPGPRKRMKGNPIPPWGCRVSLLAYASGPAYTPQAGEGAGLAPGLTATMWH